MNVLSLVILMLAVIGFSRPLDATAWELAELQSRTWNQNGQINYMTSGNPTIRPRDITLEEPKDKPSATSNQDSSGEHQYIVFLKVPFARRDTSLEYANEFAESKHLHLSSESMFRMSRFSISLVVQMTPQEATELTGDSHVEAVLPSNEGACIASITNNCDPAGGISI